MMKENVLYWLTWLCKNSLQGAYVFFHHSPCIVWTLSEARAALSTGIWGLPAERWRKIQEWSQYGLVNVEKEMKIRNHQTMIEQSSCREGGEGRLWVSWLPLQPERPYPHSTYIRIPPNQASREHMGSLAWLMVRANSLNIEWSYMVRRERNELTFVDKNYIRFCVQNNRRFHILIINIILEFICSCLSFHWFSHYS